MEDQASSLIFLSVIFGIFGKFRIQIGARKTFCRNIFCQKKPKTVWSFFFLGPTFFVILFFDEIFVDEIFWSPIPIQNFPKIPKITLRKSCDEFKATKNRSSVEKTRKNTKNHQKSVPGILQNLPNSPGFWELQKNYKKQLKGHPCQAPVGISPSSDVAEKKPGYLGVATD